MERNTGRKNKQSTIVGGKTEKEDKNSQGMRPLDP